MADLLSPETIEAYERDGFVNAGLLLEPSHVDELRAELERHIDASFRGKEGGVPASDLARNLSVTPDDSVHQLSAIWMQSEVFDRLVRHPKIAQAGAELARSDLLQLSSDQVMYKPPRPSVAIRLDPD